MRDRLKIDHSLTDSIAAWSLGTSVGAVAAFSILTVVAALLLDR